MFVNVLDILSKNGDYAVNQIRKNLQSTGTNATGETSRTLRQTTDKDKNIQRLQILGRAYFFTVQDGRKPTPQYTKPSLQFVESIRKWAEAKGKDPKSAYAIAKSIHQKGTRLYQNGGRKDIVDPVINQTFIDKLSEEILDRYAKEFLKNAVNIASSGRNIN